MAQRICFLGRGGSGKSTVAQNLGHALALKGYHVLLVGNCCAEKRISPPRWRITGNTTRST